MRCFFEALRLRLPLLPPPPLLRRFGRGVAPPGRLLPADVDWIISDSCDIVPKSCTGGRSTAQYTKQTLSLQLWLYLYMSVKSFIANQTCNTSGNWAMPYSLLPNTEWPSNISCHCCISLKRSQSECLSHDPEDQLTHVWLYCCALQNSSH